MKKSFYIFGLKFLAGPVVQRIPACRRAGNRCWYVGRKWIDMEIYYVYGIQSSQDRRIYVGMTSNLQRRVKDHNDCRVRSTKAFIPWKLIFYKEVNSRIEARKFEKYYKSGVGKEYLKSLDTTNGPVVQRIE